MIADIRGPVRFTFWGHVVSTPEQKPSVTSVINESLVRFAKGDESALPLLIDTAYNRLLILARGHLNRFPKLRTEEETATVLNQAYTRIENALKEVRPTNVRDFFGLASRHIRWLLLELARHGKRGNEPRPEVHGGLGAQDSQGQGHDPIAKEKGADLFEYREDIISALDQLDEKYREVVELIFFHNLTQAEAAEIIGVHEDTVKKRWAEARIDLREILRDYQG